MLPSCTFCYYWSGVVDSSDSNQSHNAENIYQLSMIINHPLGTWTPKLSVQRSNGCYPAYPIRQNEIKIAISHCYNASCALKLEMMNAQLFK